MAIYTKAGDKGTTGLFDGLRVSKASERVHVYGTFDELNAHISLCEKKVLHEENRKLLKKLQWQLFLLCAEVATADTNNLVAHSDVIGEEDTKQMEAIIDRYTQELPPVKSFLFLGNCESSAELHIARTVCRRGERLLIGLRESVQIRDELGQFVNRLSDFLYILARMEDYTYRINSIVTSVLSRYEKAIGNKAVKDMDMSEYTAIYKYIENIQLRARERAAEIKVPVVVTIVDQAGRVVFVYRMEDSLLVSLELSKSKAYTAVAMKQPTHEISAAIQPGAMLYQLESMVDEKVTTFGGGFPILENGNIVGGLGISGGTTEEDMDIARYALR